jgi:hypothetical protein
MNAVFFSYYCDTEFPAVKRLMPCHLAKLLRILFRQAINNLHDRSDVSIDIDVWLDQAANSQYFLLAASYSWLDRLSRRNARLHIAHHCVRLETPSDLSPRLAGWAIVPSGSLCRVGLHYLGT